MVKYLNKIEEKTRVKKKFEAGRHNRTDGNRRHLDIRSGGNFTLSGSAAVEGLEEFYKLRAKAEEFKRD